MSAIDYGKPGTLAAKLRRACHEHIIELRKEQGGRARTIVRSVYYAMVADKVIEKKWPGRRYQPDQAVSRELIWLRKEGLVGWDEIVDESRSVIDWRGYATLAEGVDVFLDDVRLDPWDGNPPVVVVESRSLASLLSDVAYTYRVVVVPLAGQSSGGFLANEVARLLGPKTEVPYLGDWDKAGGDIEGSAYRRLCDFAPRWGELWERLAVTDAQAEQRRALWIPKRDGRSGKTYDTLEAEALGPVELQRVLTGWLDDMLLDPLDEIEAEESRQRRLLRGQLA